MKTSTLILVFLVMFASVLHAQEEEQPIRTIDSSKEKRFIVGLRAGANLAWITGFTKNEYATGNRALVKLTGGLTAEYLINPQLQLMTGLDYYQKGTNLLRKNRPASEIPEYTTSWLQIPLHIGYRLKTNETSNVVFHIGPYYAFGVGGDAKWPDKESQMKKSMDVFSFLEKQDYGIGIGIDVNAKNFCVALSYDHGLRNLGKSGFSFPDKWLDSNGQEIRTDGTKFRTQSFNLTFGYKFRYPLKKQE